MDNLLPRSDVGGGGLVGALTVVFMLVLNGAGVYDFSGLTAALAVIFVFAAGWLPKKLKSLFVAMAAFLAIIVASLIALLFDLPVDRLTLSAALAGLTFAVVTYLGPPRSPEPPSLTPGQSFASESLGPGGRG